MPPNDLDPQAFRQLLLATQTDHKDDPPPVEEARARHDLHGLANPMPPGCEKRDVDAHGVPGEWLTPRDADARRVLLYFHGGGFVQGSPRSIRHFAARQAEAAGVVALVPEYRLAPEHPFPAALDDAMAAYRWLLDQGFDPARIAFSGDSAGGGLALSLALRAKQEGLPQPGAIHAISPWVDLRQVADSYRLKAEADIFCSIPGLVRMSGQYLAGRDPTDPLASPLFGDLEGLAPLFVQVGSEEVLLCDSTRLAEKAALAKVEVRLEVFPDMIHGFPIFHEHLAAARRAIREAGQWMAERLT